MRNLHVGDLLEEITVRPGPDDDPEVLTLTERKGFVSQRERFRKRLATDDVSNYKLVRRLDIAFNPYLLWAGAIAQDLNWDAGVISPLYPVFRVRPGFDPRFVYRLLSSNRMVARYDSISFGSVPRRRRASTRDFLQLELPALPHVTDQRRIADILDQAGALLAQRQQAVATIDELGRAIYEDMFGRDEVTARGAARALPLQDLALVSSGITMGRKISGPTRPIPYVTVANVQDRHLDLRVVKAIEATDAEIERYRLLENDLLLTEGGDPDKLGRGSLWRGELEVCIHQNHIFRVRVTRPDLVESTYLNWHVGSQRGKAYFLRSAKQTTGIASINSTQLKAFPVLLPPLGEQLKFADRITAVSQQTEVARQALRAANGFMSALQHRAFSGEL